MVRVGKEFCQILVICILLLSSMLASSPVSADGAAPTITSLNPSSGICGATLTVEVYGTNLTGATSVSFSGEGVTANDLSVNDDGTDLSFNMTIDPYAPLGARDVTVTTPSGTSEALVGGFTVNAAPAPTVTAVEPNMAPLGANLTVVVNGNNLGEVTSVDFGGSGVTANNLSVNDEGTQLTADVMIAADAAVGARNVTVMTPSGTSAPLVGGFMVEPVLTSVAPNTGMPGETLTVMFNSVKLYDANAITFSGEGVTANGLRSNARGTQVTATVTIAADAAIGARDIKVTTRWGTIATLVGGFTVTPQPAPVVTSLEPNSGIPGVTLTGVLANGTGFNWDTVVNFSGEGVTASNLSVNDAGTQITFDVTIDPSAAIGARDVTVTTLWGTSLPLIGGFMVVAGAAPEVTSLEPNTAVWGTTLTVFINGTNLTGATALTFSGDTMMASILSVNDEGTQITATVNTTIPAIGAKDVRVTTPSWTSTALVGGFTVTAGPLPTVTSLVPNIGVPGDGMRVLLNGTNLKGADLTGRTAVCFNGEGVLTPSGPTVNNDGTQMSFTLFPEGPKGPRDVTVTTPSGTSAPLVGGFTIVGLPTVTSMEPSELPVGKIVTVLINGTDFTGATALNIGGGSGVVTANVLSINDEGTQITAEFNLEKAGITRWPYFPYFTVTALSGQSLRHEFNVIANPPPTVTSVVPNTGAQGTSPTVLINGTNLFGGISLGISWSMSHWQVMSVNSDGTQATARLMISSREHAGVKDFTVLTPSGTSAPLVGGFTVTAVPPQIDGLNPASIQAGSSTDLRMFINGRGFPDSVIYWRDQDGSVPLATVVTDIYTRVTVPYQLISSAKTVDIYVSHSGFPDSDPFPFFVTDIATTVTALDTSTSTSEAETVTASIGDTDPSTPDSLTAAASGTGTVAVAKYSANPGTVPCFSSTDSYFDVYTSIDSSFASIDVAVNCLNGGDTVYWWDDTEWVPVSNQTYDPEAMIVTFTVNESSVPNLSDLHGSIFGVSQTPTQINPITIDPAIPVPIGTNVFLSSSFTGANPGQYTVSVDWGDLSNPTEMQKAQPGLINTSHIYKTSGVYTITAQVTDLNNTISTATYQYTVIYDPNNGFVTGGGWINSPAGAYAANPDLTGKASFGFVSKYQKGKTVPTGNTEFQFNAAGMSFSSTFYEWLVIGGAKAQYKGTGTINGAGNYRFMLTVIDGDLLAGGKGTDKFRIKIWGDNGLVYDNQLGASDTDDPTTVIGGGSIVIHK
jgi:hypothetical protein